MSATRKESRVSVCGWHFEIGNSSAHSVHRPLWYCILFHLNVFFVFLVSISRKRCKNSVVDLSIGRLAYVVSVRLFNFFRCCCYIFGEIRSSDSIQTRAWVFDMQKHVSKESKLSRVAFTSKIHDHRNRNYAHPHTHTHIALHTWIQPADKLI